jgi:hypothetical protein
LFPAEHYGKQTNNFFWEEVVSDEYLEVNFGSKCRFISAWLIELFANLVIFNTFLCG